MSLFLVLTFLFFVGSLIGWGIEVFWRRFFSKNNPERKWINPGFLTGPYLPLYGLSLCILFVLSFIDVSFVKAGWLQKLVLFVLMSLCITVVEYIPQLDFYQGHKNQVVGLFAMLGERSWHRLPAVFVLLGGAERGLLFSDSSENPRMALLVHQSSFVLPGGRIFLRRVHGRFGVYV